MKRCYLYLLFALLVLPLSAQTYKQMTNLPTVYINTTNSAEVTTKKTFVNGTWTLVDGDKTETITGLKIRCRGNSTFSGSGATKKAYRLKFDKNVSLLGTKGVSDKNWVLMANHYDKSLIRNALTTDIMGRFVGMEFSPGALFVDVVLNGTYIGNYQITDHPDVESGRLDIETPGELAEGEEPSEGFFLEADGWKDHKYVTTTRQSVPVRIHKPKDGVVTTEQADYVKSWLDRFETALFSSDFKDPEKGYRKLVDSVSLANLYLCTEMSANYDGFWSTYLFKRPNDQRMYFGPLWDYDIAYGNDSRWGDSSRKMVVDLNSGVCRSWFTRMWRDPWFRQLILRRYNELRAEGIEAYLQEAVDSLSTLLKESAALNFDKYGINTKVYNENVLHDTYAEYINDLKTFLTLHFAFLDEELPARANATYDDEAREFELNINYFYRIQSVGVKTFFDVTNEALAEGSLAYLWSKDADRRTQQWSIRQVGDAYQFINRASGLALNAPNGDLNTQLNIVQPDESDEAQLWTITLASDEASYYNIINKKYTRTANVSGGSADAGTKLICWESNEKNYTSLNRQWIITPDDFNSDEVWDIGDIYALLNTEIAKYETLMAGETAGTAPGQVSQASMNKLAAIIAEAKDVVAANKLNVNLTHSYIYYMERAWKAVDESRIVAEPIDFDAAGNYHLFQTAEGEATATASADFEQNNDTPWGFYRYAVGDGTYTKFTTYDTNGSNGTAAERGIAWYTNKEYCFVSNTGHYHALADASPAIVFTAPADGIYFATVTVFRDKKDQNNTLYLRSRYMNGEDMTCPKDSFMFAKAYGTKAVDEVDGKVPQTLDFFIRLHEGDRFTIETEAYTAGKNDGGRTHIADLAVAGVRTEGKPFTLAEAKAYPRFFDAVGGDDEDDGSINFDAEGNYRLFQTAEGATRATADAAFAQNDDTPWGFYRYTPEDGTYTKFAKFDANSSKAKAANGNAWYTNDEYCFVSENGNIHPLASNGKQASPAIAFTAPEDGIYFATMTVFRDKSGQSNEVNMRSRALNNKFKSGKDNFMFAKEYGTAAIDGVDGKVPQTLDFFVKLKQGQAFTFEIDASSDSGARSYIADLAVASCRDKDKPFTEEQAQAYERYFDATASVVDEYALTYQVDGETYKSYDLEVGASITPEAEPTKEGHTFSGWSEIPVTMPAQDVTVTGSFSVNKYVVRYYVGEQLVAEDEVEYGTALTLREYIPEDVSRYSFVGWEGETYETMPAHDIEYRAIITDGLGRIANGAGIQVIYDSTGRRVSKPQRGVNVLLLKDGTLRKVVL